MFHPSSAVAPAAHEDEDGDEDNLEYLDNAPINLMGGLSISETLIQYGAHYKEHSYLT